MISVRANYEVNWRMCLRLVAATVVDVIAVEVLVDGFDSSGTVTNCANFSKNSNDKIKSKLDTFKLANISSGLTQATISTMELIDFSTFLPALDSSISFFFMNLWILGEYSKVKYF